MAVGEFELPQSIVLTRLMRAAHPGTVWLMEHDKKGGGRSPRRLIATGVLLSTSSTSTLERRHKRGRQAPLRHTGGGTHSPTRNSRR